MARLCSTWRRRVSLYSQLTVAGSGCRPQRPGRRGEAPRCLRASGLFITSGGRPRPPMEPLSSRPVCEQVRTLTGIGPGPERTRTGLAFSLAGLGAPGRRAGNTHWRRRTRSCASALRERPPSLTSLHLSRPDLCLFPFCVLPVLNGETTALVDPTWDRAIERLI